MASAGSNGDIDAFVGTRDAPLDASNESSNESSNEPSIEPSIKASNQVADERPPALRDRDVHGEPGALSELLIDDPWVSRRHARLHTGGGLWQLTDLGSRNRAFIDGARLAEYQTQTLADGALLRLGDTLLVFRIESARSHKEGPGWRRAAGLFEPERSQRSERLARPGEAALLQGFPGCAPSARAVRQRLAQLVRASGHVLVLGETGTGKERVARAMGDTERPFVPQNCAELTRELARSELFGHLRGSFSGAVAAKAGLVEVAERGVLFLDEIGELTLDVQAELLRFLEDGCYRPMGSNELRRSGARVVAATNTDLDAAVRAGRFRLDLLARLRSSNPPLRLPPLRDRREDILSWAAYFFEEAAAERDEHDGPDERDDSGGESRRVDANVAESGKPDSHHERDGAERRERAAIGVRPRWNPGTAECLLLYPWPGNLRELRGVMRGLCAAGHELSLPPELLPRELRDHRRELRGGTEPIATSRQAVQLPMGNTLLPVHSALASPLLPSKEPGSELTREGIETALTSTAGSIRAAAHQLGIDRRKLYRLCERLGIDLDSHRGNAKREVQDD